jgi:restriction endonuclease S subunit
MVRLTKVPGKDEPDVLRAGEVVLQTRGSTYRAAIVPRSDVPLLAAGSLYILTPDARHIDPEYLVFFLNLPSTQATLRQLATGSSILNLRRSAVEEIEVPLPNLSDQRRLVEVGRLVSKQSEIGERLNQLRLQELHALALKCAKKQGAASRTKGTRRGLEP